MTAVRATFEDVKRVKTRKAWQLIFEVPEENYDAAVAALGGSPISGHDRWVGIARITAPDDAAEPQETQTEPEPVKGGRRAKMAGILSRDHAMHIYRPKIITKSHGVFDFDWEIDDPSRPLKNDEEERTRWTICAACRVRNFRELDHNEAAGQIWDRIEADYRASQSGETLEAREQQLNEGPS